MTACACKGNLDSFQRGANATHQRKCRRQRVGAARAGLSLAVAPVVSEGATTAAPAQAPAKNYTMGSALLQRSDQQARHGISLKCWKRVGHACCARPAVAVALSMGTAQDAKSSHESGVK